MRKLWQWISRKRAAPPTPADVKKVNLRALALIETIMLAGGLGEADFDHFANRFDGMRFESDADRLRFLIHFVETLFAAYHISSDTDDQGLPEGVFATATSPAHPTFLALAEAWGLDSYDTSKGPER
jgi:hypothetical protein